MKYACVRLSEIEHSVIYEGCQMNMVSGVVRMLGNAERTKHTVNYTLVEMADGTIVKNISVPNALDNFLTRTLELGGESQLIFAGDRMLMGLATSDGKRYCADITIAQILFSWTMTILLMPVLFIGLFNLRNSIQIVKKFVISQKLQSQGAIAL